MRRVMIHLKQYSKNNHVLDFWKLLRKYLLQLHKSFAQLHWEIVILTPIELIASLGSELPSFCCVLKRPCFPLFVSPSSGTTQHKSVSFSPQNSSCSNMRKWLLVFPFFCFPEQKCFFFPHFLFEECFG